MGLERLALLFAQYTEIFALLASAAFELAASTPQERAKPASAGVGLPLASKPAATVGLALDHTIGLFVEHVRHQH